MWAGGLNEFSKHSPEVRHWRCRMSSKDEPSTAVLLPLLRFCSGCYPANHREQTLGRRVGEIGSVIALPRTAVVAAAATRLSRAHIRVSAVQAEPSAASPRRAVA